jgi:hypothetical protein
MPNQVLRELGGFARRNKLSVVGGLVGLLVVLVALWQWYTASYHPLYFTSPGDIWTTIHQHWIKDLPHVPGVFSASQEAVDKAGPFLAGGSPPCPDRHRKKDRLSIPCRWS